jgi:hypothetical protein
MATTTKKLINKTRGLSPTANSEGVMASRNPLPE